MKAIHTTFLIIIVLLQSCIGEDIIADGVEPQLRIINPLQSIKVNDSYQFEATYLNNIGRAEAVEINWQSSEESILMIDQNTGLATATGMGEVFVTASVLFQDRMVNTTNAFFVSEETISQTDFREGEIAATSGYQLTGKFKIEKLQNENLRLNFFSDYKASSNLPGLYVYLTNNPNSINGAFELGPVFVYQGEHSYLITSTEVSLNQYNYLLYWCKPFSVKVGGGEIK